MYNYQSEGILTMSTEYFDNLFSEMNKCDKFDSINDSINDCNYDVIELSGIIKDCYIGLKTNRSCINVLSKKYHIDIKEYVVNKFKENGYYVVFKNNKFENSTIEWFEISKIE